MGSRGDPGTPESKIKRRSWPDIRCPISGRFIVPAVFLMNSRRLCRLQVANSAACCFSRSAIDRAALQSAAFCRVVSGRCSFSARRKKLLIRPCLMKNPWKPRFSGSTRLSWGGSYGVEAGLSSEWLLCDGLLYCYTCSCNECTILLLRE